MWRDERRIFWIVMRFFTTKTTKTETKMCNKKKRQKREIFPNYGIKRYYLWYEENSFFFKKETRRNKSLNFLTESIFHWLIYSNLKVKQFASPLHILLYSSFHTVLTCTTIFRGQRLIQFQQIDKILLKSWRRVEEKIHIVQNRRKLLERNIQIRKLLTKCSLVQNKKKLRPNDLFVTLHAPATGTATQPSFHPLACISIFHRRMANSECEYI